MSSLFGPLFMPIFGGGDAESSPTPEPTFPEIALNGPGGNQITTGGTINLGSFVQNTTNSFSVYIYNDGEIATTLVIPKNGITLQSGSSGSITTNPSSSGSVNIVKGFPGVTAVIGINTSAVGSKSVFLSIISNSLINSTFLYTFTFTVTAPVVSYPDLAVVYNSSNISSNDIVSLGSFQKDGVSDITFNIFNYAITSLVIPQNGINITTLGSNESLIINPSSSGLITLAFNEYSTFKVRLDNSSVGNKTAIIIITSNDSNKNPFVFTISYSIAKAYNLSVKESSNELSEEEEVSLGSFDKRSIIKKNITLTNNGIAFGIRLLNIFIEGDAVLNNIPSLPYVLQPNEANAVQFIANFDSAILGKRNASLKIQWEVSA